MRSRRNEKAFRIGNNAQNILRDILPGDSKLDAVEPLGGKLGNIVLNFSTGVFRGHVLLNTTTKIPLSERLTWCVYKSEVLISEGKGPLEEYKNAIAEIGEKLQIPPKKIYEAFNKFS